MRARSIARARLSFIASLPREGRVMRQVRRRFIAAGGKALSTSQILKWVYPDLDRFKHWHRWSARRALLRYAVPIGRSSTGRGLPVIWMPRN
jgi:hypothetical protein